jgi:hypothetical protein
MDSGISIQAERNPGRSRADRALEGCEKSCFRRARSVRARL